MSSDYARLSSIPLDPVPNRLCNVFTNARSNAPASCWQSFHSAACGGLPTGGERTASTAMKGNGGTSLAAVVRPRVAAHPGQSGLHSLADAHDAIAARLVLADAAQRSLDVQYFIWNKDLVGKVLIERLLRAADRGVRVRLLLDDLGTMPSDEVLLAIDSHPNIEVRMFNPVGHAFAAAARDRHRHRTPQQADAQQVVHGRRPGLHRRRPQHWRRIFRS